MTDIVERLRELEAVESELACECDCPPEATANYRYAMTCAEAADEIERLRAALEVTSSDCKEAFADNESLRLALEVAANDLEDWGAYTKANNARAALWRGSDDQA